MAGRDRAADAALQLVTGDEGGQHVRAARPANLGESQQRRQDRDRRVARHRHVHVVEVERVRRAAVDQGGRESRQPRLVADHRGDGMPARLLHLGQQQSGERLAGARHRDGQVVEHALPRERAHVIGQVGVGQRGRPFGEGAGQAGCLGNGVHGVSVLGSRACASR